MPAPQHQRDPDADRGQPLALAWRTHPGRVRARNEDAVAVHPQSGILILADGMGGANAGDVASALAVRRAGERLLAAAPADADAAQRQIREALADANAAVFTAALETPAYAGMGTTLVTAIASHGWLAYGHVGDSRLYRHRGRDLQPLTEDHSLIRELITQGLFASEREALAQGVNPHILSRALGVAEEVEASLAAVPAEAGDLFLLCSDGLNGMLPDAEIAAVLAAHAGDLEAAADALLDRACDAGGQDNISLILARPR